TLQGVTVTARKPLVELRADKTVINVEAGLTNTGTTALEALEKMPGITVDKDGNLSLKGRPGVLVLIDGKPTYLDPAALSSMLSGMSASGIERVELMDQPPARYDAAGQAGVINIVMKKNRQRGFNGSVSASYGQGFYPKSNNNLQLNYRSGRINVFVNYSLNASKQFTRVYALRRYLDAQGTVLSLLEQPTFFSSDVAVHNLRTGLDWTLTPKTSIGMTLTGLLFTRDGGGGNEALWMGTDRQPDSLIRTLSTSGNRFRNGGGNLNLRHSFTAKKELTADLDVLGYQLTGDQYFENIGVVPVAYVEANRGEVPSDIRILSAKSDYREQRGAVTFEGGWKSSYITTDNIAAYEYYNGSNWLEDLDRSNHFRYRETIHAVYGSAQGSWKKWTGSAGLRFEHTNYKAHQLGNSLRKDSAFSRSYSSPFPTLSLAYAADSVHTFRLAAARRIDRPAYQKLNPFQAIINKYTYQSGNPYILPQYTWNFELSHSYRDLLLTSISYGITTDYFSQIFLAGPNDLIIYTEGNIGKAYNLGLSVGTQLQPAKWWSLSAQVVANRKKLQGVLWKDYRATITQASFNLNNQFRFNKGWSAELTGFVNSRSQNDLQEVLDPAGQLSVGFGKAVLQNKGTLRLAVRDLFYTQWMKGMSYFEGSDEYFKLTRDTRVVTLSFTYRFGKAFKSSRRSDGGASEEKQRVGI
ncbi:MAG TPA: outer membrane beta-barrel protein, partial [Chitinophagaceae bacterium]|nr:outer membrane beta-barrel protein [Chitinophagaceae bacterium]